MTATKLLPLCQFTFEVTMDGIDNLIETLQILRDAVRAENEHKGFEAVTRFLLQFMGAYGQSQDFVNRTFPLLERLKDCILSEEFEEAEAYVSALLARFRGARELMAGS